MRLLAQDPKSIYIRTSISIVRKYSQLLALLVVNSFRRDHNYCNKHSSTLWAKPNIPWEKK